MAWQMVRSAHRGTVLASNSGIYLTSAERMAPHYTGPEPLVSAMDQASALSLVSEDVDGDGVVDVVAGYRTTGGFVLGFYRGNLDAIAPQTADSFAGVARNRFPAPFLPEVKLSASPIQPDFLASGALGSSDHDIAVGTRGGATLSIMSLDGGQLQSMQSIMLPGALTSLAAQHLDARQPYSQLLASIQTDQGARVLIFTGSPDGLRLIGATSLSFGATQIRFGDMDGDGIADAVVLADGKLSILNGKEVLNAVDSPNGTPATLEAIPVPFSVVSLALGSFVFDREGRTQMALLSGEGAIHVYAWSGLNNKAFTPEEIRVRRQGITDTASSKTQPVIWNEVEGYPAFTTVDPSSPPVLLKTRISGYSADDVMALDSRTGRLSVLAHPNRGKDGVLPQGIVLSRQDAVQGAVTALAARVNIDGRPGVVLIKNDSAALLAMMPLPDPTFTVNTTADTITFDDSCMLGGGPCSLREAIFEANNNPGVDTIMLPAGTYTLTLAGANENNGFTGDLDIFDGLNIIGATDGMGNPASIIQAGTTSSNGIDKVLSINPGAVGAFDTHFSNLEIRYGKNPSPVSGDGYGGGFDWDASGTGTLSVTNCYIHDNSTTDGPGGGISASFTGAGAGNFTISNSKVQNNTSQRVAGTTGQGGGIFMGSVGRMAMSNTIVSGNQALGTSGAGGGLYFVGPAGSLAIHTSTISSNHASLNGGGIYSLAGLTIDQGTVISNNTAGGNGGGMWSNLSSETTALSKVTITGNSAVSSGGGIQVDNSSTGNNLTISFSRLANNTAPTAGTNVNRAAGTVTATNDWWGTNSPALTIGGSVTFDPYITLTNSASPVGITSGATSTITASFLQDNHAAAIAAGNLSVLIGLPTAGSIFPDSPVNGTLSAVQAIIQASGTATETFTATTTGSEVIHAAIDGASVPVTIAILVPPSITKAFGVATLAVGGTTSLSFTITNPNASVINGIALNDTFPAGLVVATPNGATGSCGAGTITATAGSNNLALTGGTLAASTPCTFSVNVQATAEGAQNNTTGNVSSTNAGTGNTASATLTVINAPSITEVFGAASIPQSGTTSLTFTIGNSNAISTFTGLAFTDTLPAGLVIANPNALTTNCGGQITAAAGSGSVTQVNASMGPGGSCTISVNVAATSGGVKNNSVSVSSSNGGTGNTSNASLTVVGAPTITKTFGAPSIPLNGSTSLTFNLTNPNAGTTLTGIAFTDTLPAGLALSTPSGLSGACGGGTITANSGATSAALSGATLSGSATCSFSVNVTGVTAGTQNDITGAVTSVEGGTGTAASANIAVVAPPSLTKSFGAPNIQLHGTTSLSFTVTNPAANTVAQTGAGFTDNLPSGIFVASPNGLTGVCGGGSITALAGNSTLNLSGAVLAINSSCTFSVNVVGNSDGAFTNTTGAVSSTNGGTGNTASANLTVAERPTGSANFSPSTIPLNSSSTLTFTVANPAANAVPLTGLAFTDSLPSGVVVATPNGLTGTCGGGTITVADGATSVSLSGASLAPNTSCSFAINVIGTSVGLLGNLVSIASIEGGTSNTFGSSLVVMGPPTISKVFGGPSVPINGTTTLTFNIANPNMSTLNGIGFSDVLPSGVVVSTPNGLTGSCGGGTITATAGSNSVTLTGAALVPTFASSLPSTPRARLAPRGGVFVPATCTFAVNVTGTVIGSQNNVTSNITSTEGGTGGTATASLAVLSPPTVVEAFGSPNIQVNGTTSLSFALSNPAANTAALTGIALTDTLPAGLVVASPNGLGGGCGAGAVSATAAGSTISLSGGTLPVNTACSFHVNVTATTTGSFLNTTAAVTSTNGGTGTTASATLGVATPPTVAASFTAASIPLNGSTSLSFTITNPAANTFSLTGVGFMDSLPAGLVVSSPNGLTGSCGGGIVTAVSGASSIGLSGASLASNVSCTMSVNVSGATAGVKNNSVVVTSTEGGTGNTSNSSLTVVAPPQIVKVFGGASVPLNGSSTTLSFTIINPNITIGLTGIGFSDTLPLGLAIATPNGLTGSCGAGTITVGGGGPIVSLSSAALAPGTSCTFSIDVTGTATGAQNNTTSAVTSVEGGTGGTASATLNVLAPPSIVKAFGVTNISLNGSTSLTFTVTNPPANIVSLTGVGFTDNLPAGLVVATPNGLTGSCGGTSTATAGSSTITLNSVTLAINTPCTFSVNVKGTAPGMFTNVTDAVTSTNGGTGNTATATLGVATPPVISNSFGAAFIPVNGATSLSFTITNPVANAISLTGVGFTDSLPAGLVVASPNGLTGSCGAGTITATPASPALSLSGGTIASNSSCTFSINVAATTAGVKNNAVVASSLEGGPSNSSSASVTVVAPAILSKTFGAVSVALNGTTTLTFNVTNPNTTLGVTGIGFTDVLPAGLVISTPNTLTGSCGAATITATAGTASVTLASASLPASGMCNFVINVTGTAAGAQNNVTSVVTSVEGGNGASASASIAVVGPPAIVEAFGVANVALNGTTTLSFTITNPSANTVGLTGLAFTDALPAGLVVDNSPQLSNTCLGVATAVAGSSSVTASGGSLAVNSSCTITVNVKGTASGVITNTTGAVSSTNGGTGNTASATLGVATPPVITKSFGAAAITLNGSTTLTFSIVNPAANGIPLTGVAFVDSLPAGMVVASPNGLTGSCGLGTVTAVASSGAVSLTGGTIPVNSTCTLSVLVAGATAGVKNNSVGISSIESGPGNTSNASLTVVAPATISKSFGASSIALGGVTALTFNLANPNSTTTLSSVGFTDTLPAGLVLSTPTGLSGTCVGATITASAGSNSIAVAGANIAAASSCSFTVNVTGISPGIQNNTTSAIVSTEGGTGNTASANLTVVAPPTLADVFGPTAIPPNGSAALSFTIANPNGLAALSGISFVDNLPAGLVVSTPNGITGGGCINAAGAVAGSSVITLSGAALTAGTSCTFSVNVTGAASGAKVNTTSNVTSNEGGTGTTSTATLQVTIPVTLNTSPPGLAFTVDGLTYNASQNLQWVAGSSHTLSGITPQPGAPGTQYVFANWSDSGAAAHTVITPAAATTYTVSFGTQYQLTAVSNPPNGGTINPPSGTFVDAGQPITLTASSSGSYQFVSWTGPIQSTSGATAVVVMDAPKTVIASFSLPGGSISVDPPALSLQYQQGTSPSSLVRTLSVTSTSPAAFSVTAADSWITASGGGSTPASVLITFNFAGLAPGTYTSTLTFTGTGTTTVPVTVQVIGLPVLTTQPGAVNFATLAGSTATQAQVVLITSKNKNTTFSVAANAPWLSVTSAGSSTPATLQVQVNPSGLAVGAYQGSITVTSPDAANSPFTIPVTLTIAPVTQPSPVVNGISNGGSFEIGSGAPNTILSLFGSNFCPAPQVLINGIAAEILAATAAQINITVPAGLPTTGNGNLMVVCNGLTSLATTITLVPVLPAIFTASQNGSGQGTILNQDFNVNSAGSPTPRNQYVSIYGTGFGPLNPPASDGLRRLSFTVTAFIGDIECVVVYAGEAPGFTSGLQQINILIPNGAATGPNVPIRLVVNGVSTQGGVTIAVQ